MLARPPNGCPSHICRSIIRSFRRTSGERSTSGSAHSLSSSSSEAPRSPAGRIAGRRSGARGAVTAGRRTSGGRGGGGAAAAAVASARSVASATPAVATCTAEARLDGRGSAPSLRVLRPPLRRLRPSPGSPVSQRPRPSPGSPVLQQPSSDQRCQRGCRWRRCCRDRRPGDVRRLRQPRHQQLNLPWLVAP
eukprot:361939-Chlamydomonas_euryale.AAC.2